ncbi:unnamed protein product [Linum trigynum]|uniref:Uncharacterized protein n=1 Tax=Linum trigynum TaxID=586398 RepID=A0AAV2D7M1_9ROSI
MGGLDQGWADESVKKSSSPEAQESNRRSTLLQIESTAASSFPPDRFSPPRRCAHYTAQDFSRLNRRRL